MKKIIFYFFIIALLNLNLFANEFSQKEIKILKNIRCLVCQGQSVADSNSEFAQTIKLVVKEKILKGETEEKIYSYLVDKYGEWIFYKPSIKKSNLALWLIPYLVIFLGGFIILMIVKKRRKP